LDRNRHLYYACRVMANDCAIHVGLTENERLWRIGRGFVVRDLPWTEDSFTSLPPFEFENWAVIAVEVHPTKLMLAIWD